MANITRKSREAHYAALDAEMDERRRHQANLEAHRKSGDLVPINRRGDVTVDERKHRLSMAEESNKSIAKERGIKRLKYQDYKGVAGSRGYELPGVEVKGVEVSAKRAQKKDEGGAMHGKKKVEMKSKGEKPEGYFLGGVARGLRKAAGGAFGAAGALLGRRRSRPAPTPASPPDPAAIAKLRSRMPGGVSKLMGGFRRPAAPAPTAAPAAGAANQAAPPTQTPPAFKYCGVVPSKKASMKDREEQKWVKSVQKKAGGGKKGC